jgi:hypothetical protein
MSLPAYEKLGVFYLGRVVNPQSGEDTPDLLLYDSRDLTTHAVCVGMTGSGKTGLCIATLEEAAIDGVPAIAIDPKGDLGNLLLTFPDLAPADFAPWVDPGEAARKNLSVEEYAAKTAATWTEGLAQWDEDAARIERLKAAAEVAIYTPGSAVGRPLSVLKSFSAPGTALIDDAPALRERINATVSGLLGLVGLEADPIQSREHILLANLLDRAWRNGLDLDLPALIQGIQKPPFDKVGVFDVETFYPPKDRMGLAMAINNLLASPGFEAWMQGEPLDMQRLLYTHEGKPRIAIISIAHLNDAERMFVVTLLLNEVVAWMRRQSGTSSLRALVYMDEIFGYFPPTAMPPSKLPLLTLMKQARAFGVGVMLATQNPVDLDYKGLSNAGTWLIGRLQTERDKARVIEGLLSSDAGGLDKREIESLIANLQARVFLMRNVHDDAPVLFRTRWALSYLRGPLTLNEIGRLCTDAGADAAGKGVAAAAPSAGPTSTASGARPVIPAGIDERFLAPEQSIQGAVRYLPRIMAQARTHFIDRKAGIDAWEEETLVAPPMDDDGPDWTQAQSFRRLDDRLVAQPLPDARYAEPPATFLRPANYTAWAKQLAEYLYRSKTLNVIHCPALKMTSAPGGTEGEFRARIAHALRERRDAEIEELRGRYAAQLERLTDQIRRAEDRVAREKTQATDQKLSTVVSIGTTLLGALMGRKRLSATTINRAGTSMRRAGRIGKEQEDVARAEEGLDTLKERYADMETELEKEIGRLQGELDPAAVEIVVVPVRPRKSDTDVSRLALLWVAEGG